ncbi:MAG: YdeI/OmpD-associated family protein [Nocardioidaceae bacterium]|nr:YdeI/OmpD-associated family protein [Nocardioidaceae bacterium]
MVTELPQLLLPDAAAWRDWLASHHASAPGVWLVLHRKGGNVTSLTYADALDEALCVGWIDGQSAKRDAESYQQRMTRRGPRSAWSARNVKRVARLERENRMQEAGMVAARSAQADGRWQRAYEGSSTAVVPADLAAAIAADPRAQEMFDVLTAANRYALIYRVNAVKRAETRSRKIAQFVEMLARHEAPYSQKRMPG